MDKWKFYQDPTDEWRWTRTAPNGEVVGASTESYANLNHCKENARRNGFDESEHEYEVVRNG